MTSNRIQTVLAMAGATILAVLISPSPAAEADSGRITVLTDRTIWRHHVTFRPPVIGERGRYAELDVPRNPWVKRGEWLSSPMPASGWQEVDFDDSDWPRSPGALFGGYGDYRPAGPALICVRGRFGVRDPRRARGVTLAVKYRGGVVVYVNDREVARGHLPKGELTALTPATDYPRKAFVKPDGQTPLQGYGRRKPPADLLDRYEARIRSLRLEIPARLLRTGTNVVAFEVHRSPVPKGLPAMERGSWDTAGLVGVMMTAENNGEVRPNVEPSPGVRIWPAGVMLRIGRDADRGDPFEPVRPVRMTAPRNGTACGQVVVSAPKPAAKLRARMGELRSAKGKAIDGSVIRVRYAQLGGSYTPLREIPPTDATIQPVWLTARIPEGTAPGTYRGSLIITGLPKTAAVPVELTVVDWLAPDPGMWRTTVNLLQSPESVAGHYKVPLWSDEHFKLIEPSLKLMGEMGNDVVGISAVAWTVFGNDPLVQFRKVDGKFVPDLSLAERYLRLYAKHAGEPKYLSVNVWSYGMYYKGWGRDGNVPKSGPSKPPKGAPQKALVQSIPMHPLRGGIRAASIPVIATRGGRREMVLVPMYGREGTEELWRAVMDGLRGVVRKIGWREQCLMLGTSGDTWPSRETIAMFRKIAPDVQWRVLTHGGGAPRWGVSNYERTQLNGMTVGYLEIARRIRSGRIHVPTHPVTCNARDLVRSDPFALRALPITNTISSGFDGFCWKGLDYWEYITSKGKRRSALNTYVRFGNMVGGTPRTLAAPGPKGAVPTVQYEMLRQGTQESEAALSIREGLKNLYSTPGQRFDVVHLCLEGALSGVKRSDGSLVPSTPRRDIQLRLLYPTGAADTAKGPSEILAQTLFFGSGKKTVRFKPHADDKGTGFDLELTVGDDRWSKGGSGRLAVRFQRDGESCTGTFDGSFGGVSKKGRISGSFVRGGFTRLSETPPAENEFTRRCNAAIDNLAAVLLTGSRTSPQGGADVERHVRRLYATAAEVARAVKARRARQK